VNIMTCYVRNFAWMVEENYLQYFCEKSHLIPKIQHTDFSLTCLPLYSLYTPGEALIQITKGIMASCSRLLSYLGFLPTHPAYLIGDQAARSQV
jgi:hypothetical protein